jgi:hypothetical protein
MRQLGQWKPERTPTPIRKTGYERPCYQSRHAVTGIYTLPMDSLTMSF